MDTFIDASSLTNLLLDLQSANIFPSPTVLDFFSPSFIPFGFLCSSDVLSKSLVLFTFVSSHLVSLYSTGKKDHPVFIFLLLPNSFNIIPSSFGKVTGKCKIPSYKEITTHTKKMLQKVDAIFSHSKHDPPSAVGEKL